MLKLVYLILLPIALGLFFLTMYKLVRLIWIGLKRTLSE